MEVREFRQSPFCWQDKPVLRHINNNVQRKQLSSVRNVYLTLTEIASDYSSEDIKVFIFDVSNRSGLSDDTVSKCLDTLQELGIIDYGEQKRNSNGKYDKKEIRLINTNLTVPKFQRSSKEVPKKFDGQTSGYIEYNKEINIESNIDNTLSSSNEEDNKSTQLNKEECYCSIKEDNKDISVCKDSNKEIDISKLDCNNSMTNKRKNQKKEFATAEMFEGFWKKYPRKTGKVEAMKSFSKVVNNEKDMWLLAYALFNFCKIHEDKQTEQKFIPHAATWLNQKRFIDWEDEYNTLLNNPNSKEHPFFKQFNKPTVNENLITKTVELDQDKLNQGYEYKDGFYVKKRNYDN